MAVDTPARIIICGAGPIGLEAGLYARFLGYDVEILERGDVADSVQRWGHVRMFSPFGMNHSTLGRAALEAHDKQWKIPDPDELLTGNQWRERYLLPLSQTDLLSDHIRTGTNVLSISREQFLKHEQLGQPARAESTFRVLVEDHQGTQSALATDVVIDTSGVYGNPNWMGPGGGPAVGESDLRGQIEYGIPDVLGSERERYLGQTVLLVGAGFSAATSVTSLAQLATQSPETRIVWVTRGGDSEHGPIRPFAEDRLSERARLTEAANSCAARSAAPVEHRANTWVQAIEFDSLQQRFSVEFSGEHAGKFEFDRVVSNVGYRPDEQIYCELQVHQCYATSGPLKLAAALLGSDSADCLDQTSHGPETLVNPEPDFYILGAKSYGRNSNFLVQIGLQQIRELFSILGGRDDLDLYAGALDLLD